MPLVSCAYFVPAGYRSLARAVAVVSAKPLVLPGLLDRLQLDAAALVLDTTEGFKAPTPYVRRMLTFDLGLGSQFLSSYTSDSARASVFANLFTAQVQMLTGGIGVVAADPILFLTPLEIFSPALVDSWWRADTTATLAAWTPRYGARVAVQANVPQQFDALIASPDFRGLPTFKTSGGARGMQTAAAAALPQPWSLVWIGYLDNNANQTMLDGLAIDTGRVFVDTFNAAFRTVALPQLTDNATAIQAPTVIIGSARGATSALYNNFDQVAAGDAGAGTPTGITIGNDGNLGTGAVGQHADVVLVKSAVDDAQAFAVGQYACGWYGVGVVPP